MSERDEAIALANKVLERPWTDPDGDLALLSRQLLRSMEREEKLLAAARYFHGISQAVAEMRNGPELPTQVILLQKRLLMEDAMGIASKAGLYDEANRTVPAVPQG